ncbi:MAG: DUF116 domain-containing protein [Candidatus Diapherotrites archaeon]|jgi:hypothetical protein|uniref:DUF116 domain-containing protein n=1 Tax=Candidatus Iainarchaeum sp. TaxID=3101447 RepID=A0A7K4BZM4_9ARCH|nr:DUF116 domain-containing protein [Candidatus Diapherotrites archaeon]
MVDTVYEKIRTAIGKALDDTTHFNAANAAQTIGKSLGLSDSMIQYTHVELRNTIYESEFKKVKVEDRMLFLPHCSRNTKVCKATLDDEGYHCKQCGGCNLGDAVKIAKQLGYKKIFIVPGGSLVKKIIDKEKPKAVVGVCCFNEALMSIDMAKSMDVVPQVALLLKDGCSNTQINLPLLEEKLSIGLEKK